MGLAYRDAWLRAEDCDPPHGVTHPELRDNGVTRWLTREEWEQRNRP